MPAEHFYNKEYDKTSGKGKASNGKYRAERPLPAVKTNLRAAEIHGYCPSGNHKNKNSKK